MFERHRLAREIANAANAANAVEVWKKGGIALMSHSPTLGLRLRSTCEFVSAFD
jgi:hypothetical protein